MTNEWSTFLANSAQRHGVPGVVMGIYQDGRTTVAAAGVQDLDTKAPVTPVTVFRLGSMTKIFTALLVLRQVERRRLSLDGSLVDVWPELRLADAGARETLTLRHLLSHRAGFFGDVFDDLGNDPGCLERYAQHADRLEQITPPGVAFSYNNAAFVLAARLTEEMSGSAWDRLFISEIAEPLGMTRTGVLWANCPDDVASCHLPSADGGLAAARAERENRTMAPAGATPWTTAADALALGRMFCGVREGRAHPSVISDETIQAMIALSTEGPTRTFAKGWGLGVQRFDGDGRVFGHDGAVNGQLSFLRIVPEYDLVLALFTNGGDGRGLFQAVWEPLAQDWPEQLVEAPPQWPEQQRNFDAGRYVGRYAVKHCQIDVEPGDGELVSSFRRLNESRKAAPSEVSPLRPEDGDQCGELFLTLTPPARLPMQQRFTSWQNGYPFHLLFRGRLFPRVAPL